MCTDECNADVRFSLTQSIVTVPVKRLANLESLRPNPKHTGVLIRTLAGEHDPDLRLLHEATLSSLLDRLVDEEDYRRLTKEHIAELKEREDTQNQALARSIRAFLVRFHLAIIC